jgi:hypothetical protein
MKIECDECGRSLDVESGAVEVRCECGNVMHLPDMGAGSDVEEEVSAEDLARKWYYAHDGERYGPVPLARLKKLVEEGVLSGGSLIWSRGMDTWQRAETISQLRSVFTTGKTQPGSSADVESKRVKTAGKHKKPAEPAGKPVPDLPGEEEISSGARRSGTFFISMVGGLSTALGVFLLFAGSLITYFHFVEEIKFEQITLILISLFVGALLLLGFGNGMVMLANLRREVDSLQAKVGGRKGG